MFGYKINYLQKFFLIYVSVVTLIVLGLNLIGALNTTQLAVTDKLYYLNDAPTNVIIIDINEESLARYGNWPWSRDIFGDLVTKLNEQEVRVIGFDITFIGGTETDQKFFEALKASKAPVVLASKLEGVDLRIPKLEFLSAEKATTGYANLPRDPDQFVRRVDLLQGGATALSYQTLVGYFGKAMTSPGDFGPTRVTTPQILINYLTKPGTVVRIPIQAVLDGQVKAGLLKNKVVLVGTTVQDLKFGLDDNLITPVGLMPGVEIHANVINTILGQNLLIEVPATLQLILTLLLLSFLVVILFDSRLLLSSIYTGTVVIGYWISGVALFRNGYVINFIILPLLLTLTWFGYFIVRYITRRNENNDLRKAFSQYVNPQLLSNILEQPELLKLGGQRKHMTVMFSDIRGFTSISERMQPEELVEFLNKYLTEATNEILNNQGAVDKYLGDAIMAFWNAPLDDDLHAYHACVAALKIKTVLKAFNESHGKNLTELQIGIGINTGEMVVGNMGSEKRFDYTVMGDNVNLASRLEGLTKQYGVSVLLGEAVIQALGSERVGDGQAISQFKIRKLDRVTVKGKAQPIDIYELMAEDADSELIVGYEKALGDYLDGKFAQAAKEFGRLAKTHLDKTAKIMELRCEELRQGQGRGQGQGVNWPGYWKWETK